MTPPISIRKQCGGTPVSFPLVLINLEHKQYYISMHLNLRKIALFWNRPRQNFKISSYIKQFSKELPSMVVQVELRLQKCFNVLVQRFTSSISFLFKLQQYFYLKSQLAFNFSMKHTAFTNSKFSNNACSSKLLQQLAQLVKAIKS